jgi:hypothetical protein
VVDFSELANVPAWQGRHESDPRDEEKKPLLQAIHAERPVRFELAKVPGSHCIHIEGVLDPLKVEKVPAGQGVQLAADEEPELVEYDPAEHRMHIDWPILSV